MLDLGPVRQLVSKATSINTGHENLVSVTEGCHYLRLHLWSFCYFHHNSSIMTFKDCGVWRALSTAVIAPI